MNTEPTRIDFSKLQPPAARAGDSWEKQQALEAALQARYARQRRLESQPDLRVTDAVRKALVRGEALSQTSALTAVQRWRAAGRNARPCLVLAGGVGSGKSVAAAWLIAEAGGVWLTAASAVRVFAGMYGEALEEQREALGCHTLVLEDVGAERDDDRMGALLVELLEARKGGSTRTLITTNLRQTQFLARYADPRLVSRVTGESVQWVNAPGEDLRRRGLQP
jgi:DNA replication protein DnaC